MTGTSEQQATARRLRFDAWKQRRGTLAAEVADARVRIANLNAPGALRANDPLRPHWIATQEERLQVALEDLEAHDAMGTSQYSELLNPSAEPAPVKSFDSQEIDRLNRENSELRTLADNQREQLRRLAAQLQAFKRAADGVKAAS